MPFHTALKALRLQDRLTQEELALRLGVSKSTISMLENGERKPSFELLEAIADYFNVSMSRLWDDAEKPDSFDDALIHTLDPALLAELSRFVQLAKANPDKALRFLSFANQEIESQK